jgi:hypothetical protein
MDTNLTANERTIRFLYRKIKNALSYHTDVNKLTFEKRDIIKKYAKRKSKKCRYYQNIIEDRYPLIVALSSYGYRSVNAEDMVEYINCMYESKIKNGELKCL